MFLVFGRLWVFDWEAVVGLGDQRVRVAHRRCIVAILILIGGLLYRQAQCTERIGSRRDGTRGGRYTGGDNVEGVHLPAGAEHAMKEVGHNSEEHSVDSQCRAVVGPDYMQLFA